MADKKISDLNAITGANTADGDLFVIVDTSANETKSITKAELFNQDITIGGNLTVQGTTITVDSASAQTVDLGDNDKIRLGDGDDLQIYHDGSNSLITDVGTGSLFLRGTDIVIDDAGSADFIRATSGGDVKIYYNGSKKLATTNTGIDVTGTVTADENITIDTSSSGNGLTIQSSGNTYNRLTFDANRSASGNLLGEIMGEWNGTQVAAIRVSAGSDTTNKDDGQIYFLTSSDGTGNKNRVNIANNGDISFYEDTGTTAKFFWDASAETLTVGASSGNTNALRVVQSLDGTSSRGLSVESTTGHELGIYRHANSDGAGIIRNNGIDTIAVKGGNVGIGTTSPTATLDATVDVDTWVSRIYNTGSDANAQGLLLRSDATSAHNASVLGIYADGGYKMMVKSTGNVGIGTSSPQSELHVKGEGEILRIESTDATGDCYITFRDSSANKGYIGYGSSAHNHLSIENRETSSDIFFQVGTTEAMRIDSSGNLLIGTTSDTVGDNTGINTNGSNIFSDGTAVFGKNGNRPLILNRGTNDGDIVQFKKDGATVGSIDSFGSQPNINGGTSSGLSFGSSLIYPRGGSNTVQNGTINLGNSSNRFKDLYLSGQILLGTTSAIGKLRSPNAISIADDSSVTLSASIAGGYLVTIYDSGSGSGAVAFITYTGAPIILAQSGFTFSTSDTDGNFCILKSTYSHSATFKNRIGGTRSFNITILGGNAV